MAEPARRNARPRLLVDLTPLRVSRDYRLLFTGNAVSYLGRQLTVVAIPFQVFTITGSSLAVGMIGLATVVPLVTLSLAGGAIADAVDRRKLLLVTQLLSAATSAGLALNAGSSSPRLWPIYVLAALSAGLAGADQPARNAMIPNLVGRKLYPSAASLGQIQFQVGQVAGPALAGLIISQVSLAAAYWIDVAGFGAAVLALMLIRPQPPEGGGTRASLSSIAEGLRYVRGRKLLVGTFLIDIGWPWPAPPTSSRRYTILQLSVPDGLRGRLSSVHIAVVTGGPQFGDAEAVRWRRSPGPRFSVVSGGVACILGLAAAFGGRPNWPDTMPWLRRGGRMANGAKERTVADVMTKDVLTASSDDALAKASARMIERGVGSVVVVDPGTPVGILTERDLVRASAAGADLASATVADWMTPSAGTVAPGDTVLSAFDNLTAHGYRHLPVVDNGQLVGLVSIRDMLSLAQVLRVEHPGAIEARRGLEGVVVAETEVGDVRGQEGFYHYRQYNAVELAEKRSLEDVWHLLYEGHLPSHEEREAFSEEIRS
ncbi:MAG TPA: MFS transporter, partial [Acidimicrobiales bacterium]|nr:MFS transporter [Acidimicrobiales bacterium]